MGVLPESNNVSWIMNFVVPAYCCMLSDEQVWSLFAAADFSLYWFSFKTGKSPVGCQSVADKFVEHGGFCVWILPKIMMFLSF